ncbi:MAG: hypothetical protein HQK65_15295 [Desulfamplus sp.]|nr:hypothetical protein [Desulfamplus sp.]
MKTKKMPVSISYGSFKAKLNEFLIPFTGEKQDGFRGLQSGLSSQYGSISFIGKEITANDVFAKLVDSGQKIDNVEAVITAITDFLGQLQQFKVGNIISIYYSDDGNGFKLEKEANRPPQKKRRLP